MEIDQGNIVFEDEWLVAINKPHGLLVHKTKIAEEKSHFAVQKVRDLIGQMVWPIHRLDRGTGGVLLFGKNKEVTAAVSQAFALQKTEKRYLAITRGFVKAEWKEVDKPLAKLEVTPKKEQPAVSFVRGLEQVEIPVANDKYPCSRYSLVEVVPKTGRTHQIRRHLNFLSHPILGDYKHGDYRHNNYFKEHHGLDHMLLHAFALGFVHPETKQEIQLYADLQPGFKKMMTLFDWEIPRRNG